jgi:hypothetical protein
MKQEQAISAIPYILAFLALLYLALPHVVECYESYARPWSTREEMTNADVDAKQAHHEDKDNTVWEMFGETEVNPDRDILPGEPTPSASKSILPGVPTPSASKSILPGVPTPSASKSILPGVPTPSASKSILPGVPTPSSQPSPTREVEPSVNKPSEPKEERTNKRIMDRTVQKPSYTGPPPEKKSEHKVTKVPVHPSKPYPVPKHKDSAPSGQPIQGPRAPKLDPNQPRPSDSGNGKNGGGVYPQIYGPDSLDAPGSKDNGGDFPPFDYLPAAEFPAGPLQPSPYLNDFSKMLKT